MLLATVATLPAWTAARGANTNSKFIARSDLPADLARAVKDYDQATMHNDVATLARLVADDYLLVNSDSTIQDKQSYLEDFKKAGFSLDPYELREPVRKVWSDCAITGGLLPLGWTQDGAHQTRLLRVAHVWIRQEGRWRLAYTQLTRVPQ
jgi:ketosteroid isomerase-like protein